MMPLLPLRTTLYVHWYISQVISVRRLNPPNPPLATPMTLPPHHRPSILLRPISEVEPLYSGHSDVEEDAKQRRTSSDFVTQVKMRIDGGKQKVLRYNRRLALLTLEDEILTTPKMNTI